MCELKQEYKSKITNTWLKNQFPWEKKKNLKIEICYLYSLKSWETFIFTGDAILFSWKDFPHVTLKITT